MTCSNVISMAGNLLTLKKSPELFGETFSLELPGWNSRQFLTDVQLRCRNGATLACHRFVLAAVSRCWASYLKPRDSFDQEIVVVMADYEAMEVAEMLNRVYEAFEGGMQAKDVQLYVANDLAGLFGWRTSNDIGGNNNDL